MTTILRAATVLLIAALILFALAYAITQDGQFLVAVVISALAAWCVSEPVRQPIREEVPS